MTQLNNMSLREIFQEALKKDKDFIKELLRKEKNLSFPI
jgi:hypothetical protein